MKWITNMNRYMIMIICEIDIWFLYVYDDVTWLKINMDYYSKAEKWVYIFKVCNDIEMATMLVELSKWLDINGMSLRLKKKLSVGQGFLYRRLRSNMCCGFLTARVSSIE